MAKAHAHAEKLHFPVLSSLLTIQIGDAGVSLFFAISGYLITTLLLKQSSGPQGLSLRDFYFRRFFRIFPPYYAYLAVVCLLWAAGLVRMNGAAMWSSLLYVSNYVPYSITHPESTGWVVGHSWSLSLEEQFYLFWPLLVARLDRRKLLGIGIAMLLLSPVSRVVTNTLLPALQYDWQITRMFHTRIDTIMMGSVLALLETRAAVRAKIARVACNRGLLAVAMIALAGTLVFNTRSETFHLIAGLSIEAALLTLVMRCCIEQTSTLLGRVLNWSVLRHIGVLSYSLYLWQQLFSFPSDIQTRIRAFPHSSLITVVLTFVCAELSYFTIEKTSLRVRDVFLTRQRQQIPAS